MSETTRQGMEVQGYIIQYICDEDPTVNDLTWGYDDTVQQSREGKTARLPESFSGLLPDGRFVTKRAHRAFRGKFKDYLHMLEHGTEPYCNRLQEVPLTDLPFKGLEPDTEGGPCRACVGSGKVAHRFYESKCSRCGGTGRTNKEVPR